MSIEARHCHKMLTSGSPVTARWPGMENARHKSLRVVFCLSLEMFYSMQPVVGLMEEFLLGNRG